MYKQQSVIKDKQLSVKEDLDQVEPAVIEAQNGTVVNSVFIDLLSQKDGLSCTVEVYKCVIYYSTALLRSIIILSIVQ